MFLTLKEQMQAMLDQINQELSLKPMSNEQVKKLTDLQEKLKQAIAAF